MNPSLVSNKSKFHNLSHILKSTLLGPGIFIQYAEDVDELFSQHGLHHHLFAVDMQGHCSGRPVDCTLMVKHLERCITGVPASDCS